MNNIKIGKGVFETALELEHASIKAGFPSPADDYTSQRACHLVMKTNNYGRI